MVVTKEEGKEREEKGGQGRAGTYHSEHRLLRRLLELACDDEFVEDL